LFAGSDEGAKRMAILQTIVVNCELHGVEMFAYLRDVPRQARRQLAPQPARRAPARRLGWPSRNDRTSTLKPLTSAFPADGPRCRAPRFLSVPIERNHHALAAALSRDGVCPCGYVAPSGRSGSASLAQTPGLAFHYARERLTFRRFAQRR